MLHAKQPATRPPESEDLASDLFREIAEMSRDKEGVSRPAFSHIETQVLDYLAEFARSRGLDVRLTPVGQCMLQFAPSTPRGSLGSS